jgi:hypothetical protein
MFIGPRSTGMDDWGLFLLCNLVVVAFYLLFCHLLL